MKIYFASIALLFAACSSNPLAPGAGNDPGTGTNTLLVEGNATADPHVPNAQHPADFSTDFSIRIQLNGVNVTTGTVTMQSEALTVNLTYNPNANNNGRWEGTAAGYDEVYRLDVVSGADSVRGVVVDGPDIHTITAPLAGASLDSTVANDVKWQRGEGAQLCSIRTNKIDRLTIADNGLYSMPPGSLEANKDSTKENEIEIRRSNQVIPAGAIGGSMMTVSVSNGVTVLALANPAL